ncbi:MAG: dihydroneopterin aldolase [Ectothiorhodospiraceae bacterium]|nr:dihydroneopterin aldolase [Ectothiorhodospiraceae bacterium]MCH8504202.1 dihydroneopterin aldolase [Ectothiorhodospiraceae bacterium]
MNRVFVEGLSVQAVIGTYDWERELSQTVVLDLEMAWDTSSPAEHDDLAQALDYTAVCRFTTDLVQQGRFHLLETLAERLAAALQEQFGIRWLRIRVAKPGAVAGARTVGVVVERGEG